MLRIDQILIQNFKQFIKVDIKPKTDKGIFLFIGRNGRGKTNFLNAIYWCLYGKMPFRTHHDNNSMLNDEVARVNPNAEIKVSIFISDGEQQFLFERGTRQPFSESWLKVMREVNNEWEQMVNPEFYINRFLDESIARFFLFDGEGIRDVFRGDYQSKLKESIWKVSQVTLLDNANKKLSNLINDLERKIGREVPEAGIINNDLEKTRKEIGEKTDEKSKLEKEFSKLNEQRKELIEKQKKYEKYEILHEQRQSTEDSLSREETLKKDRQVDKTNLLLELAPYFLIKDLLLNVNKKITEDKEKGIIPAQIKPILIRELIDMGKCICGTPLTKGSESLNNLKKKLEEVEPQEKKEYLVKESFIIENKLKEVSKFKEKMEDLLKKDSDSRRIIERYQMELKELSGKLKEAPDKEVGEIQKTIEYLEESYKECHQQIITLDIDISRLNSEEKMLSEKIAKIGNDRQEQRSTVRKLDFIKAAKGYIDIIREKIIDKVRRNVNHYTNKYFKELIWKQSFEGFEKVEFTEDYEVNVFKSGFDKNYFKDLSTGETKVLTLATIKALTEISGFNNVPVFFDAPLSDLDPGVQDEFLDSLPAFMKEKQLFIFSLDENKMKEFGIKKVQRENFYKFDIDQTSKSVIIKPYHD